MHSADRYICNRVTTGPSRLQRGLGGAFQGLG